MRITSIRATLPKMKFSKFASFKVYVLAQQRINRMVENGEGEGEERDRDGDVIDNEAAN